MTGHGLLKKMDEIEEKISCIEKRIIILTDLIKLSFRQEEKSL
jgi:hypothetical protein